MNRGRQTVPLAMRANVEHLRVLHQQVVIVSLETQPVPAYAEIAVVDDLGFRDDGITHVTARFRYLQRTDIPTVLAALPPAALEAGLDLDDASYFLSSIELRVSSGRASDRAGLAGMPRWRRQLFVATARLTADASEAFELPRERTVITGSRIVV
jgi:KUP system potassium uptake protein